MSLKQLNRVLIRFNPAQPGSKSIKEFVARCGAKKAKTSNPECVVKTQLSVKSIEPTVTVEYANGYKDVFHTRNLTAEQIVNSIKDRRDLLDSQVLLKKNGVTENDKFDSDWGQAGCFQPRIWTSVEP
jgi:large subunit ribosomal protein L53|uniref:Large ribosomal subunit protein mL53 n=1 Tax=Tetraselmis chuii TaxID=63592 RepID=A0A7S1TAA0_9CHLO|mmetsp:Transcript_8234/g.14850  ORF Transcript_8234/g.14850 Transcript_8234/m.14850 type:complete len:128 (+) Transcript_8234:229-612(+)|eukprot:CAMPEP_0177769240 /NCGR_PEP_ID=MMETSP0491_2-20121128/10205_1 /TAXON_ID=63592 /ORGANISM="Tetraselmis chuii, Strain PLY429" /LENGTH=127 /DNA_ID=CAMNT_0019286213 /DNA_START=218 /DNA_END=601 /DNA_ORIENTATION=+